MCLFLIKQPAGSARLIIYYAIVYSLLRCMGWVRAREAEFLRALTAGSYLVSHSPQSNISIVGTQQRKVDNKLFPARLLLNKGAAKRTDSSVHPQNEDREMGARNCFVNVDKQTQQQDRVAGAAALIMATFISLLRVNL
jgi:hypothetical protein